MHAPLIASACALMKQHALGWLDGWVVRWVAWVGGRHSYCYLYIVVRHGDNKMMEVYISMLSIMSLIMSRIDQRGRDAANRAHRPSLSFSLSLSLSHTRLYSQQTFNGIL